MQATTTSKPTPKPDPRRERRQALVGQIASAITTIDELDASDPIEPLLRLDDVVERLQVTRQTVRGLLGKGGLRFMRVGRTLRFKREWVEEFIERTGRADVLPARVNGRRRSPRK